MCDTDSGTCVPCEPDLSDAIWNTDAGDVVCSTPERPVKAWSPEWACPRLTEPCAPPPLPEPQCPKFTNRGGEEQCQSDACDCYCYEEWVACEVEPPAKCGFPQGLPESALTGGATPDNGRKAAGLHRRRGHGRLGRRQRLTHAISPPAWRRRHPPVRPRGTPP